ncbi:UNVERIFIED_CONTAM: hypothetical protein Slati_2914800 [Sesamum latifolium]|uniref:Zinc knuckle CX2CX4HX4C domain-containing protein n=1 Tax=Sesamum latifolium TaxID=2727402 RepID=A0AAW2VEN1_9LAMI
MHVALDDCDFYIHVHDLPLSMMNLGMTTLIGNRLGSFRDLDSDNTGCSWGATMRIQVSLNVHQPLKRALKLRSPIGKELMIRFTYECLPNFYYLCGRLGHIDKYCEIRFEDGYRDVDVDTRTEPGGQLYLGRQTNQQQPESDEGGSVEEEVESTPLACFRGGNDRDTLMLGAEEPVDVRTRPVAQQKRTVVSKNGCGADIEGTVVEDEEGRTQTAVGEIAAQEVPTGLNLVNVPLQFTSQNMFSIRGSVGRGCRPVRGARGRPRKRNRGAPVLENDAAFVHNAKRRLNLVDNSSDSISAVSAGNYETLKLELSGVGPPLDRSEIEGAYQLHKPGLVFLSEIKCKARRSACIKELVNYNGIRVDSMEECKERWRFTGFYGYPEVCNRGLGWDILRRLAGQSTRPWIYARDFNEILEQHEKRGNIPQAQGQMKGFRHCLADCDFLDHGCKGDTSTWCNRRETPNTVWARLDRACGNQGWLDLFPQTTITHEPVACSDHSVIWIGLEDKEQLVNLGRKRRRFRFEAAWIAAPDCVDVINMRGSQSGQHRLTPR